MMDDDLPAVPTSIEREYPDLWSAYVALGEAASQSGPLDRDERRLVHLALAIGSGSEGATHSHVRRGLAEGMDGDELEQVALLAVTTLGWPKAMRALSWIRDITRPPAE
jgi:alkylhydroperoxidase/carboxymuconolactone decarboxylase family protein YurZ